MELTTDAMRAERSGDPTGRYVGNYTGVNNAIVAILFTGTTVIQLVDRIMGAGEARYGCSSDVGRAYNRIALSGELQRFVALTFPNGVYAVERAMLGISCIPAVWDGLIGPTINAICEYGEDTEGFQKAMLEAAEADREAGVPTRFC